MVRSVGEGRGVPVVKVATDEDKGRDECGGAGECLHGRRETGSRD